MPGEPVLYLVTYMTSLEGGPVLEFDDDDDTDGAHYRHNIDEHCMSTNLRSVWITHTVTTNTPCLIDIALEYNPI